MPELEKSIEKEVALTSIKAIMESNNIDIIIINIDKIEPKSGKNPGIFFPNNI